MEINQNEINKEFEISFSKVKYLADENKFVHCVLNRKLKGGDVIFWNGYIKERHADFFILKETETGREHIIFYLELFDIQEYKKIEIK